MSADRRSQPRIKVYKMQKQYAGGYLVSSRDVTEDRLLTLMSLGWRKTELEARYKEVEDLNRAVVTQLNLVWTAVVVKE